MKRIVFILVFIFCRFSVFAIDQDELLNLRKDFISAGIDAKAVILRSLSQSDDRSLIPIYQDAVEYVKNSYAILQNDEKDCGRLIFGGKEMKRFDFRLQKV